MQNNIILQESGLNCTGQRLLSYFFPAGFTFSGALMQKNKKIKSIFRNVFLLEMNGRPAIYLNRLFFAPNTQLPIFFVLFRLISVLHKLHCNNFLRCNLCGSITKSVNDTLKMDEKRRAQMCQQRQYYTRHSKLTVRYAQNFGI